MNKSITSLTAFAQKRLDCDHPTLYLYWSYDELICQFCGTVTEEDE